MTSLEGTSSTEINTETNINNDEADLCNGPSSNLEFLIQENVRKALATYSADQSTSQSSRNHPQTTIAATQIIKLTPLNTQDPRLWLNVIESQFALGKITSETTKFHHLLAALNDRIINDLSDVILAPKSATPYSDLKKTILDRLCDSNATRIHRLLQGIELGDLKPSQLFRRMKTNAGADVTDEFLKTIWLRRLPVRAQEVLAPLTETLTAPKLAELADRVHETMSHAQVMSITPTDAPTRPETSSLFETTNMAQLNEITRRLDHEDRLRNQQQFAKRKPEQNRARSNSRQRNQNNSLPKTDTSALRTDAPRQCYFHFRYQEEARNCKPGCPKWEEFKSKN